MRVPRYRSATTLKLVFGIAELGDGTWIATQHIDGKLHLQSRPFATRAEAEAEAQRGMEEIAARIGRAPTHSCRECGGPAELSVSPDKPGDTRRMHYCFACAKRVAEERDLPEFAAALKAARS